METLSQGHSAPFHSAHRSKSGISLHRQAPKSLPSLLVTVFYSFQFLPFIQPCFQEHQDYPAYTHLKFLDLILNPSSHHVSFRPSLGILTEKLPAHILKTSELVFNQVFQYYGIPEDIVSSHVAQFTSWVWSSFMDKFRVSVSLSSGYHSQSNEQVEHANQEICSFLRT